MVDSCMPSPQITGTTFLRFGALAVQLVGISIPHTVSPACSLFFVWDGLRVPGPMGGLLAAVFSRTLLGFPLFFAF